VRAGGADQAVRTRRCGPGGAEQAARTRRVAVRPGRPGRQGGGAAGGLIRTVGAGRVPGVEHEAFYLPQSDTTFTSTAATAGPWDPAHQHAGPPSALIARALARHEPADGQRLATVAVDILRPVPLEPLSVRVRTVRPGRLVTLLEAEVEAGGQPVLRARGWRIARSSPALPPAAPAADAVPAVPASADGGFGGGDGRTWAGAHLDGYLTAMEWRFVTGGFTSVGPAQAWARPRIPLVAGEETGGFERVMLVADSGNGISAELDPARWLFVNVDLTVTLYRQPAGEWVLLDAATVVGPDGVGLATSRLADTDGVVGRGAQTLVVTPHRGPAGGPAPTPPR
jgi:hypothetical protein